MLALLAVAAWGWRYRIAPGLQDKLYARAVEEYRAENFSHALTELKLANLLVRGDARVVILRAWCYWRLGRIPEAESDFARAVHLDPASDEAKTGLAEAYQAQRKFSAALPLLQSLARKHPEGKGVQMSLASAYIKSGQNQKAGDTYRNFLEHDNDDDARRELLGLYGFPDNNLDKPLAFSPAPRATDLELNFRTRGNYFQFPVNGKWKDSYIVGVNIGPAQPGEFPSTCSREYDTYMKWFQQIGDLNANTVRSYTILPPAFYQALKDYNANAKQPLYLIQEVWIPDDAENLYNSAVETEFQQEVTRTIDLIHGQADVPFRSGHNYGIYTADISRYVLGLAVGREVDPKVVQITNAENPTHTSYDGRYISLPDGNPSEAWFARMCDFAVRYEVEKYNAQRPITVVNWPPLDPLRHPTESTYKDELEIRKSLGEQISEVVPRFMNDADVVSVDIKKFKTAPDFEAGLFALYHIYQHWPDFMLTEPAYAEASDTQGPNRYLGYLQALKNIYPDFPLFVGEYGLSTSLGAAHVHPQGWNNGGLSEQQQADLLVRFTQNIRDSGYAGGLVFEWQDEWFKHVHDQFTAEFEEPWDRNPLWMNALDPEKNFGLIGFEPVYPVPLLRGERDDWQDAKAIYPPGSGRANPGGAGSELQAAYAMSDFEFLYLRLDVQPNTIDWSRWNFWIALNTLPGQSGSRTLPDFRTRIESGANFLIKLAGPDSSRILISENYDPNHRGPIWGRPNLVRVYRKQDMKIDIAESSEFEDISTEANSPRYVRDGRVFPALEYDRSPLPFGTADRTSPEYSSIALCHADPQKGTIELRIPWGTLYFMDPSALQVFGGTDAKWVPQSLTTHGISIAALAIRLPAPGERKPRVLASALPPIRNNAITGTAAIYTWQGWNQVWAQPYFKAGYAALQKQFSKMLKTPLR